MEDSDHHLHGFKQEAAFEYRDTPVYKFVSERTGLRVVLAQVEGPCVNGYAALATEALDDDGCPHVLEHLIFLGSKDYPYKGVLDKVANRCFAQGTNAWTDTDHTCYTLTTAGADGFLNLLPVYLDHILFPTLTDDGFTTEVHHINGEGENAGVVYCEMQGRENTGTSRAMLALQRLLFPEGCGYRYETGGLCASLRSLHPDKVRAFHRSFYRPDNIVLVVTGQVLPSRLLSTLSSFEVSKVVSSLFNGVQQHQQRPWWSTPVPELTEGGGDTEVEFPSDNDTDGALCYVAWLGPVWDDLETRTALSVLWDYLSESAVSPLQKALVERDDPHCSRVHCAEQELRRTVQYVRMDGAPTERLPLLENVLMDTLRQEAEHGIDMVRMQSQLRRARLGHAAEVEEDPHNAMAYAAIGEFLYGNNPQQLETLLRVETRFKALETWTADQWTACLQRWLIDAPHVVVRGRPSCALAEQLQQEERERVSAQAAELGPQRLEELGRAVEEAAERNDTEIPEEMIRCIPVPDVGAVSLIPVTTHRTDGSYTSQTRTGLQLKEHVSAQGELPMFVQFDHINSAFVQVHAYMDTSNLPSTLRPYIELYLEAVFDSAIERDGCLVPHEEVVRQLQAESVSTANGCGMTSSNFAAGPFPALLWLSLKFENTDYARMLCWLRELLWQTRFDAERLSIAAAKLINDVARVRRAASKVTRSALKHLNFDPQRSNHAACNFQRQHAFLTQLQQRLEDNPSSVLEEMDAFRRHVTNTSVLRLHIAGGILPLGQKLSDALSSEFLHHAPTPTPTPTLQGIQSTSNPNCRVPFAQELLLEEKEKGSERTVIFGLPSTDSGYLQQTARGLDRFDHEDGPALMVAIEYLTSLEGPMWRHIRGQGLAYSYGIHTAPEEGLTYFTLFKSGNLPKAYAETGSILDDHEESEDIDELELEAARSSSVFEVISREETVWEAAEQQFLHFLKRVSPEHNLCVLRALQTVSAQDVCRVMHAYLVPLFHKENTRAIIVTNPSKVDEIITAFETEQQRHLEKANMDTFFTSHE